MKIHEIPTDPTPAELVPLKIEFHRLIRQIDILGRQIAQNDIRYDMILHSPIEKAKRLTEPVRWGYECKTVRWHGQTFHFTDGQAEVVRLLKYYFDRGIRRVREASLTMALRIDTSETDYRLIDRFKAGKKYHPAIDTMIFVESAWWSIGK